MKKESGLFTLGVVVGVVGTYLAVKHKEEINEKVKKLEKKIKDKKNSITNEYSKKIMNVVNKIAEKVYKDEVENKKEENNIG